MGFPKAFSKDQPKEFSKSQAIAREKKKFSKEFLKVFNYQKNIEVAKCPNVPRNIRKISK